MAEDQRRNSSIPLLDTRLKSHKILATMGGLPTEEQGLDKDSLKENKPEGWQ